MLNVEGRDKIMIVQDGGKIISVKVDGISIEGRQKKGVKILNKEDGEKVV